MSLPRRSFIARFLDELGLPVLLGIPVGLGVWYFMAPGSSSPIRAIVAATGGALLGVAYFILEGARDLTEDIVDSEDGHVPFFSWRLRPLAILTFFLLIGVGVGLIALAVYLRNAAT